jgi:pimeloyl-ACP methyl ester carboxylesterase
MSHQISSLAQHTLARRAFLHMLAGTAAAAALAACRPVSKPSTQVAAAAGSGTPQAAELPLQKIAANGVELHYVEQGQGEPLVLLHGGFADYREWSPLMARMAQHNRVIAYSQRYYYPNQNLPIAPGYTTLVDAEDLAAFLQALSLDRSHVVGYSSGAYMALAMALQHPELLRTLTLAEPPIIHWLPGLPGGGDLYADFMSRFWQPTGDAFRQGDAELAMRTSVEFFAGADVLDELPPEVRQELEENLAGWEAFTTSQDCFPMIDKAQVAELPMPVLLITAENTLPIHQLVNDELSRLLPQAEHALLRDATHEMLDEQPQAFAAALIEFLRKQA